MKRAFCIVLCVFITLAISACNLNGASQGNGAQGGNENNGGSGHPDDGEYIWRDGSELFVIGSAEEFAEEAFVDGYNLAVSRIYTAIGLNTSAAVQLSSDASPAHEREIVIGRADREISRKAYELLSEIPTDTDDDCPRYLIYSDGRSIAIAFDRNSEHVAIKGAVDYFTSELMCESLTLPVGIVKSEIYSMKEIYQARDDKAVEDAWISYHDTVERAMAATLGVSGASEYADKLVYELKDLYSMYSDDLVAWFAGLYEPYICICDGECQKTRYCGGAGFYYSNSARDNRTVVHKGKEYLLLPDAETTAQVLGFIKSSGMLNMQNGDYHTAFPDGESERIVRFIKALQDEDSGYFYHPQWHSMLGTADFWDSRQSRDLGYSLSVLSALGASPTYDTPSGALGDGILYDGTRISENSSAARLTLPLTFTKACAVSRVVATGYVHPRLESRESFAAYLKTLNLAGNSYYVGNELSSLAPQIIARDKELGTPSDPRPLATMLDGWLRENQDPNTGHWHKTSSGSAYYPINGLLKIATLYNTLELPFPNPLAAARSAFSVIASDTKIEHVCDLYNTWFAVSFITQNLKKYSNNASLASEIMSEVRVDAIEAVRVTNEKMRTHLKPDGSFSYFEKRSSATSQNAPVAIANTNEGDVNATVIFTYGILGYMFDALGFGSRIQMFTECDRVEFVKLIEEKIEACELR